MVKKVFAESTSDPKFTHLKLYDPQLQQIVPAKGVAQPQYLIISGYLDRDNEDDDFGMTGIAYRIDPSAKKINKETRSIPAPELEGMVKAAKSYFRPCTNFRFILQETNTSGRDYYVVFEDNPNKGNSLKELKLVLTTENVGAVIAAIQKRESIRNMIATQPEGRNPSGIEGPQ